MKNNNGGIIMFKNLTLVIAIVVAMASVSMAADLGWSQDYSMKDNISILSGSDDLNGSAGEFIGTLGEVKLSSGKKLLGLGGASFHIGDSGNMVVGVVPVTLFDDMVQFGVSMDMSDFRWNNPENYLFSVGFSASGLVNKLWK